MVTTKNKFYTIASRLNKKIIIEQSNVTADGSGGYVYNWEILVEIYAEIIPISGKEQLIAERVKSIVSHKITIRYINGILTDMRIKFNNRIFLIQAVLNIKEENRILELYVNEESD